MSDSECQKKDEEIAKQALTRGSILKDMSAEEREARIGRAKAQKANNKKEKLTVDPFGPRPECCELINKKLSYKPAMPVSLCAYSIFKEDKVPFWHMDGGIEIFYCPFCGVKLPPVKLKTEIPSPIWTEEMGGDYCGTCHDRSRCCRCHPPEAAYEIVKS